MTILSAYLDGSLAQLGEHLPYKQRVRGSSPLAPTTKTVLFVRARLFYCNNKCKGVIPMKEKGLLKTAFFMAFAVFLSKVFGLLRDVLLASNYGTTVEAIAFDTGSRLPILLFDFIIGGVITAAFIPIFNEIMVKESKEKALRFADSYMTLIVLITAVVAALGIVFAAPLVDFLAPDIPEEAKVLAVRLTRIMFPMIIFTGLAFSYVGILQSLGEFRLPAIISLISNGIVVLYFLTLDGFLGIYGLSVFFVLGWAVQAFVQIPKAKSLGYVYHPRAGFNSPYIKSSLLCALPILISSCVQPLCTLINTRYASGIAEGRGVTALNYANKLYIIVVGIFSFVATNLLFPKLSRASASGEKEDARSLVVVSSKLLVFIVAPISVGFAVLAEPFIKIVYERGEFTVSDTSLTAAALRFFAVGMIFMAINEVLTKSFFATKDTKTPMITAIVSMAVNFVLVGILTSTFGIGGVALSSGTATAVNCILNYLLLGKKSGRGFFERGDLADMIKCIVSSGVMAVCVYFAHSFLGGMNVYLSFGLSVAAGVIVYAVLNIALKTEEMMFILHTVTKKKG